MRVRTQAVRHLFPAACFLLATVPSALAAGSISGIVTNRTNGNVASGDTVALIGFAQGMQVAAETKADANGHYSFSSSDDGQHLIRVTHQKATYFQPVPPGAHTVDVDVYDVAASVEGVVTEADVLSMQTLPGGELQVTDDFFVRNGSDPPRTRFSNQAYEFFLPEGAKLQGAAAMAPGGRPVEATPTPLPGQGHYAFVFPIRPGSTRFQAMYTLPYAGKSLGWTQRESLTTENLVVLLPKTMRFMPGGTEWQTVPANPEAQTFVRKGVAPGAEVSFKLAGEGQLPRDAQNAGGNTPGTGSSGAAGNTVATQQSMAADTRPGGGLGPPVDTPDPLDKYKGWLLGGLGILLLGGAGWLLRGKPAPVEVAPAVPPGVLPESPATEESRALRPALERALLALEREHALGAVGEQEYVESRGSLQKALHRALAREAGSETSKTEERVLNQS